MSKAINQLKELYLLSNIALCDRDLNVPDYQTKTVYGLLECIKNYIDLKGFELNHEKENKFSYGILSSDDNLIQAVWKRKTIHVLIKHQDKIRTEYEQKLEDSLNSSDVYFFRAIVVNSKQFEQFIEWFEKNVIEEGGPDER